MKGGPTLPGRRRGPAGLPERVREVWERARWTNPGDRVVVACSGGPDSLGLLHLLRFPLADLELDLEVAHFDHAMREESGDEARWLRGVSRAWGLPFHAERAAEAPTHEAEARTLRYAFLTRVLQERGGRWLVTAHHADDQVETVLFRIFRGTGVRGLRGIPQVRDPGVLRPLLEFPGRDLEAYVRERRLRPRQDPTNISHGQSRSRIRHALLPLLDEIHPGAREGTLRLARNAARATEALDRLLEPVLAEVVLSRGEESLDVDRNAFLDREPEVRRALLRGMARELGVSLSEAGTGDALEFISTGSSGGRLSLPGSVLLSRDFQRIRLRKEPERERRRRAHPEEGGVPLRISSAGTGEGEVRIGGRSFRVRWGPKELPGDWVAGFDPAGLAFPLEVRGWQAGHRTRSTGGGRKLKKLFGELRVPREERRRLPLLTDGGGGVLWIPGRHRAPGVSGPDAPGPTWFIGVEEVEGG